MLGHLLNLLDRFFSKFWAHHDVVQPNGLYLRRYFLTPVMRPKWWPKKWRWFRVFLHHLCLPDDDRAPHNHPSGFTTLILSGSYTEHVFYPRTKSGRFEKMVRVAKPGTVFKNPVNHTHFVIVTAPAWSLVLWPEPVQEWGFWIIDQNGLGPDRWVKWDEYLGVTGAETAKEDKIQ